MGRPPETEDKERKEGGNGRRSVVGARAMSAGTQKEGIASSSSSFADAFKKFFSGEKTTIHKEHAKPAQAP
mgnify:CR=1 FL=1|eukprot:scaffold110603_cov34-Tisochrysis_lutea.AAC.7